MGVEYGHLKRYKKQVQTFHKSCQISIKVNGPDSEQTKKFTKSYQKAKKKFFKQQQKVKVKQD